MHLLTDDEIEAAVAKIAEPGIISANAFRMVRKMGVPLSHGQISDIARTIGASRFRVGEAVAILEIFKTHPQLRERWEDDIASGRIGMRKALWQIQADAAPLDRAAGGAQTAPVVGAPWRRSASPAPAAAAANAKRAKRRAKP